MKVQIINSRPVTVVTDDHIGPGNFYPVPEGFDLSRIMECCLVNGELVLPSKSAALLVKIDSDTDAIYRAVQGDRAAEYLLAETDATAYKNAGYTGIVPSSVQSWANAKAETAQWSADNILATAAAWRNAQAAIRANRLALKEQARTVTDLASVEAQWNAFVVVIRNALGVPL